MQTLKHVFQQPSNMLHEAVNPDTLCDQLLNSSMKCSLCLNACFMDLNQLRQAQILDCSYYLIHFNVRCSRLVCAGFELGINIVYVLKHNTNE